jgi:cyclophilin family peptidyl-prolyl cis-trans isomerase
MRSMLFFFFGALVAVLIIVGVIYNQNNGLRPQFETSPGSISAQSLGSPATNPNSSGSADKVSATMNPTSQTTPSESNAKPDLSVDTNGLSKATVVLATSQGTVKFKFYTNDAPKTTSRIVELITSGFYNGLSFHRVVPGFVVQGGDPLGNGTGGSGKKIDAEFNDRRHIMGTVAMARAADPNSADSQFYFSLGSFPHLDKSYTVFGQVTDGLDVIKKIRVGDKIVTASLQ